MGYFLEPGAGFNEISSDTDIIKVSGLLATAMATGSVTVYVVATNHCGVDSSSITISVTTNTLSPVSGPDSLCAGSVMVFTDLSSGGNWSTLYPGYFDYNIDPVSGVFNSGYSFYGPAFITYGTPSCNVVDTLIIEKAPISAPISGPFAVVVGATVTYANDSAGGIWSISNTALATIDPHTGVLAGLSAGYDTLYYTTTNATGCTYPNNHIIHILADPESVSSINNTASFTVYPNPATGNLNITWAAQSTGNGIVTISDVSGRTVYASSIEMSAANHARLDISSLKAGVYMISIQSGTGYYCSKLVVGE